MRDYEIAGMRQLTQEFVFSFDAGEEATAGEAKVKPITTAARQKGAYYTPIDTAKQLRKRRLRVSGRAAGGATFASSSRSWEMPVADPL